MTPRRALTTFLLASSALAIMVCAWIPATQGDTPGSLRPSSSAPAVPPPGSPSKGRLFIGDVQDTGQFLPDTAVILRVGDHVTTVRDYIEAYFASDPEMRPGQDSLGRVAFLHTLIDKGVLDIVVERANRPMTFEDRHLMREYEVKVLSNVLFKHSVADAVTISEEDIARVHRDFGFQLHLRHILFEDQVTAQRVRDELVAGRIAWKVAYARHSRGTSDSLPDGDIGWHSPVSLEPALAGQLFSLKDGAFSALYDDDQGTHVLQVLERRPIDVPPIEFVRGSLERLAKARQTPQRVEAVLKRLRADARMEYDSANILWAVRGFVESRNSFLRPAAVDTGRVLARTKDGPYTLGALVSFYQQTSPLFQVNLNTFNRLRNEVDTAVLEPYKAQLARQMGLEKDSLTIHLMDRRRLEIQAEHLYQDSIFGRVQVSAKERRKYFDEHLSRRMTDARIRYAIFPRSSTDAADSVVARLRAGEKAHEILRADSLKGARRGRINEVEEGNEDIAFKKLLFEEMKPGEIKVYGPLPESGQYLVLQHLSYDLGHALTYKEVEELADESVRNIKADKMMRKFLDRHRRAIPIVARPQLVMRIRLIVSEV